MLQLNESLHSKIPQWHINNIPNKYRTEIITLFPLSNENDFTFFNDYSVKEFILNAT